MASPTKKSNQKLPNFLIDTARLSASSEGLNSSLAQSTAELWLNKDFPNIGNVETERVESLKTFEFFVISSVEKTIASHYNLLVILADCCELKVLSQPETQHFLTSPFVSQLQPTFFHG